MRRNVRIDFHALPIVLLLPLLVVLWSCPSNFGGGGTGPSDAGSPAIGLSPSSLSFSAVQGGASPSAKTVSVTNTGGGTLSGLSTSISYTSGSGWLTASLNTTVAPATLTVTPTTGPLVAGTYNATVWVSSVVADVSPQTLSVSFVISSSGPAISLSPTSLSFSAVQGGANPSAKTVSVTNIGSGTLSGLSVSFSYTSGSGWLSASLDTTTAPATLTVTPATGSLVAGTYSATVSVSSGVAVNSPQTMSVSFVISSSGGPAIGLSPTSLSFSAVQGGASPSAKTVSVTNIGSGTLSSLSTSISYTSGSGWLSASLDTTTAPASLTVTPTTGPLVAGTYSATVSVSSGVAGNSPQTVAVSFVVSSISSYTLTTAVSPSGSGSVGRSPDAASYSSGTVVTLTASASSGYAFSSWSGDVTGTTNPTTVTMSSNKSVTANFAKVPVLSGPSSATGQFQLTWTFVWPGIVSTDDHYVLEYSYNQTSGYAVLATYANGVRTSPYADTITPEAVDIGKTSYFRVRAWSNGSYTPYSNVIAVSVPYLNLTFYPNYDNAMYYNSADSSYQTTVYSNALDVAGTDYFYNIMGLGGWISTMSAFRFDINNFITGRTINKATLILWPSYLPGDFAGTYAVNGLAGNWSGSTITFNNCPSWYTSPASTKGPPTTTAFSWNFDVTAIVQTWASGTKPNYGLVLRDYNIAAPGQECYRAFEIYCLESAQSVWPTLYVEVR